MGRVKRVRDHRRRNAGKSAGREESPAPGRGHAGLAADACRQIMGRGETGCDRMPAPAVLRVGRNDAGYPKRLRAVLGGRAPEQLHLQGNTELLDANGVGFCGSRKPSGKGMQAVRDCAEQIAKAGVVVVSGGAAGIDCEAHHRALAAGGATILVLPEGLGRFRVRRRLRAVWDWGRVLVVS